jgi:Protein of unknown function (DUF3429)
MPRNHVRDRELPKPPLDSLVFGSAPFLVILGATILVIITARRARTIAYHLLVAWSGAILALQAGVRRGLSFDQPGGARMRELATMLWVFVLAFAALVLPVVALPILALGYLSVGLLDYRGALRGDAPLFFTLLRPAQAGLAAACLIALQIVLIP